MKRFIALPTNPLALFLRFVFLISLRFYSLLLGAAIAAESLGAA
jgi:hypothetical protein